MQNDILEVIKSRRSTRKFRDGRLDSEKLQRVLKAGLLAPSSGNKRPVEFIVVQDRETIGKLKECKKFGTSGLDTAPCAIVVIADSELSDVWPEDASIATILLQLEAESLDLGTVWIQIRNRQSDTGNSEDEVRAVLNIPEKYGVLDILAIGYKDERKNPYGEEDLDFSPVHKERF
ncbi:nitroreductase family protein [Lachnospiraceae bacterium 54-53]